MQAIPLFQHALEQWNGRDGGNQSRIDADSQGLVRGRIRGELAQARELTDRQQNILFLLAQGLSSKEVALKTSISHRTVEHQIGAVKRKLGARNVTHAVAMFVGQGLIG